ncbi:MAG: 30S ribosomal protein S21 [Patescibacteria group bacterium]
MALELKKKEGESVNSFLFRFNKKIQQSGLVREVKKRRFRARAINSQKRKLAALHRMSKKEEIVKLKRFGYK